MYIMYDFNRRDVCGVVHTREKAWKKTIKIIIIAYETHGTAHSSALDFLNAVGGRSAAESGDARETSFLWQRNTCYYCYVFKRF